MIERVGQAITGVIASCANQLGGTFLLPASTYSLPALLASLAVFVVLLAPRRRRRPLSVRLFWRVLVPRRVHASASGRTDLAFFVLGLLFSGLVIGGAILSSGWINAAVAGWIGAGAAPWLPGPVATVLMTALLFLAYEFAYWLDHWLKHKVPLFWHFHKVHHQAESLSLFTNSRVHPVDTILFHNLTGLVLGVAGALGAAVLGAGVVPVGIDGTNALVMLTAITLTHLQHSHLWVGFGPRWGRRLLGPAHHQIHHSSAVEHHDRNFGNSLALFDRLFGTFAMPPERRPALRFGVTDDVCANPHGWRAALIDPVLAATALLIPKAGSAAARRIAE